MVLLLEKVGRLFGVKVHRKKHKKPKRKVPKRNGNPHDVDRKTNKTLDQPS